ncbi:MAG: tRNA (adenosine(37)-N6)-threonylcarbamoyltransferase complex dimerization subunit type 1 TsaB [Anaerolineales bacterium]
MLLAIDTATRTYGIALHDGERVVAEEVWRGPGHATSDLPPEVARLMLRAQVSPRDLQGIAVAQGPGSFTGLRIGLALAKGLSFVRRLPLIAIPTHDILVAGLPSRKEPLLALVEAGRGRAAGRTYQWRAGRWQPTAEPEVRSWTGWWDSLEEPTWVCGEIEAEFRAAARAKRWVTLADPSQCVRRPAVLAELAWGRLADSDPSDAAGVTPLYIDTPAEKTG